jgi:hypothetical protein
LWSKFSTLPVHLSTFKIAISETGPHHSWTTNHLLSFSKLQLDNLSHLSVLRITQPPHFSQSGDTLEYDAQIDDVAALKGIPRDIVESIRGATALTVLECDWWSWRPEDIKALLEQCTQLEVTNFAPSPGLYLLLKLVCLPVFKISLRRPIRQASRSHFSVHPFDSTPQAFYLHTPRACSGSHPSHDFPSTEVVAYSSFDTCCFSRPPSDLSSIS